MDYITASSMEWMEMDAGTIHFHAVDTWTVNVEWIASLHIHNTGKQNSSRLVTVSLEYMLSAIRSLGSLLAKEETSRLTRTEEEHVLTMVLLLVLHDVCFHSLMISVSISDSSVGLRIWCLHAWSSPDWSVLYLQADVLSE
jgi:hypothetical protein